MPDSTAPFSKGPNCWHCRFFAVSWDPRMPYACHRLGFKSPGMPALEVLRVDGQACRGFVAKSPAGTRPAALRPAQPSEGPALPMSPTSTRQWRA